MNQKTIILAVSLFLILILGMFTYSYLKKSELNDVQVIVNDTATTSELSNLNNNTITAKHYFIDGTHTFVGEMTMPTPCDLLESTATVMESYSEQIKLDFAVINNAENCEQTLTNQRFSVSAEASGEATISATLVGQPIQLNLVPASEGEKPDEFELYIKG